LKTKKWQRKGDGVSYVFREEDRIKAVITPQYHPNSKRAGCWDLEIATDKAEGLGAHGVIERAELRPVGTYPTLKMAKQMYFNILTERGNTSG